MPGKGNPRIRIRFDSDILPVLRIEARRNRMNVPTLIRAITEAYLGRVKGRAHRPGGLSEVTLRKATMAKLRALLGQLRFEIATVDAVQIREKRVNDLSSAIEDITTLAKSAEPKD